MKHSHGWGHDDLAADLAGHLRTDARMVWTDIQLGPSGSPRPDVYAMMKSFVKPEPTAYEVKVSVSDFRADVTAGKWMSYRAFAGRIVFAVPAGLISPADVPTTCGLMVRSETGWRAARKATASPCDIDRMALLKLLIDGVNREGNFGRLERGRHHLANKHAEKRWGEAIARQIQDAMWASHTIANANAQAEAILLRAREDAARAKVREDRVAGEKWGELLSILRLPAEATEWDIREALERVRIAADGGVCRHSLDGLASALGQAQRILDRMRAPDNKVETEEAA